MSYQTAERFILARGRKRLLWFRAELCKGRSQREIALELQLSRARVSQLVRVLFRQKWIFAQSTIDALQFDLSADEDEVKEIHQVIEEDQAPECLRLIKKSHGRQSPHR